MNETIKKISPAFEDARGVISNILEEEISHVAIITSRKGSIRGNHYHPKQFQYADLIRREYESVSKSMNDPKSKEERLTVCPGDLVITPPMIAHAMRFLEDSLFLNLTTGNRNSEEFKEHTKEFKLIK